MLKRMVYKLTSARFLIAVLLTVTFMYLAIKNRLTTEFVTVYTAVTVFYFNKTKIEDKED